MNAWQFKTADGGIEKNRSLPAAGAPIPKVTDKQVLVEVFATELNPVNYKLPEMGFIANLIFPSPCTPGRDFCGKVVEHGSKANSFHFGEMYVSLSEETIALVSEGLRADDAAGIIMAGLTAYQSIKPYVKEGDNVFINGDSGGTGVFGIQIANLFCCHETTTCSITDVDQCKSLGADEVIDYKLVEIGEALQKKRQVFNLAVDNIGSPAKPHKLSQNFLVPDDQFIQVGTPSGHIGHALLVSNMFVPRILGGGKRTCPMQITKSKTEKLTKAVK